MITLCWSISTMGETFCRRGRSISPPIPGRGTGRWSVGRCIFLFLFTINPFCPRGWWSSAHSLAGPRVMNKVCQHVIKQLLGIMKLFVLVHNKTCLCVGHVSSSRNLFILVDSFQQMNCLEYIFYSSVPMGSQLNSKFMVTHIKENWSATIPPLSW